MNVRSHEEAEAELLAAIRYYSEQRSSAGAALSSTVNATVEQLCLMPYAAPTWPGRPDVRRRVLHRFPYSIMYTFEPAEIFIVAVAHHKRQPGYWLSRLPR
jgi:toxin ParE1/3/4